MVSVIIPVYNASSTIIEVMDALLSQSYPSGQIEIIVVDNGSKDNTVHLLKRYPVKLLFETGKQNPYAARNKGLKHASGEIIAMTDANKIPDLNWIEYGVKAMQNSEADFAGGDIRFKLDNNATVAEKYDAITFNNNRRLVNEEGGSAAGNLFFRRSLIEEIGLFPSDYRSGMDMWWTQKAVRKGHKIIFARKAVVYCVPRTFRQVLKKSYRVGISHPLNLKSAGKSTVRIWAMILRTFMPPGISSVRTTISGEKIEIPIFRYWFTAWLSKIMMGAGRLKGITIMNRKP